MKRIIQFCLILTLAPNLLLGQYYVTGTDPGSIKWNQIKTDHFRLVYPPTFKSNSQYVANGLEYFYPASGRSLNSSVKKSPVILHDRTTIPSSVTPYAPYRIDFFTAPPQDIYAQDWVDQLIIHEFRHANQYQAVNRGFTKGLTWILGEQGLFAMIGFFIPLWFIEGDATMAETAFCNSGRGRVPSFEMRLRAQFLEKGIYSYEKAVNRSYKDMTPGPYELGYHLVGRTREIYGKDVWAPVLENVGKHPYTFVPFSSRLKKQTGMGKYDLYKSITTKMLSDWSAQDRMIKKSSYTIANDTVKKFYTNYNLPQFLNDTLIVSAKSSFDDITRVVLIDNKQNEKRLFIPGVNFIPESFSLNDSILYWSELVTNPRWSLSDYRVINSYNLNSGKVSRLTRRTRYYAPAISKDGSKIAAAEVEFNNDYYLSILKSSDGSLIKRVKSPDNLLFIHPAWGNDTSQIVSVVFGFKGNSIALINPWDDKIDLLLPFSNFEIKRPSLFRDYIIYTASYDGIDNIYAVNIKTREIYRVTSSRFGAADAAVDEDNSSMLYSEYSADGYNIARAGIYPENWGKITVPETSAFPLAEKMTQQENFVYNRDSVPDIKREEKAYSKFLNLFNLHSWFPAGADMQNFTVSPGITLLSQNILGTSFTYLGYLYDPNQKTGKYYINYTYEGLYPAFDLAADWGSRKDLVVGPAYDSTYLKWKELNLSARIRLPLKWTHNYWIRSFQPSSGIMYKYMNMDNSVPESFVHDRIPAVDFSFILTNMMKTSYLDLFPRWGQEISGYYSSTLPVKGINSIAAGYVKMNFPGILRHHSLRFYAGYQKEISDYYSFEDYIDPPRGYANLFNRETACLYTDYSFPIAYPDLRIGHMLFIKRVKASLFFDYSAGLDSDPKEMHNSAGVDLSSDLSFFNLLTPFDIGLRTYYLLEYKDVGFQFLFSININSIYGKGR